MLLSEKYKFIYLKTHKTASTSVELALEQFCAPPEHKVILKNKEPSVTEFGIVGARASMDLKKRKQDPDFFWHHMGATNVVNRIGEEKFFSYSRVTTVRNPFSRLASLFYFQPTWGKNFPKQSDSLAEAIELFEKWLFATPHNELFPYGFRAKSDKHIVFYKKKFVMTDFIRVENLSEDLQAFTQKHTIACKGKIELYRERDNSRIKKFKAHELFHNKKLIERAQAIDSWIFDLGIYPDHPLA